MTDSPPPKNAYGQPLRITLGAEPWRCRFQAGGTDLPVSKFSISGDAGALGSVVTVSMTVELLGQPKQVYEGVLITEAEYRDYLELKRANWPMQEPARGG